MSDSEEYDHHSQGPQTDASGPADGRDTTPGCVPRESVAASGSTSRSLSGLECELIRSLPSS